MDTTQHHIMDRITRRFGGRGAVVTPKDFVDLAGRDAVDQALTRLSRSGTLNRVGRGLYHWPRINKRLGIAVPRTPTRSPRPSVAGPATRWPRRPRWSPIASASRRRSPLSLST
jgi:hypothetical protein